MVVAPNPAESTIGWRWAFAIPTLSVVLLILLAALVPVQRIDVGDGYHHAGMFMGSWRE